ncbi:hypothetical protein BV898_14039 [Hypsibius exemplaris]|uniref:Hairy/enhancer-of-split related with YRPW motif protein 1 n=1 Tax=Hypsibius exemplaris TaxID=2072580 RepID=A0A1W0W915_HYPEX|nr:hypothetical protein BV898_14039 [Hypsibius exemplaris]
MDYPGVVLRTPGLAHMSASTMLHHPPPPSSLPLPPGGNGIMINNPSTPLQYGSWETRESSPLSDSGQSQMMKDSMERTLNFSTSPHDDEYGYGKKKTAPRDPMSHRIIEKRRRDRMNNCLADLSRLIPSAYLRKQGRGRIEKTEIIEMAIKHIRFIQSKLPSRYQNDQEQLSPPGSPEPDREKECLNISSSGRGGYSEGYKDCFSEVLQYLVDGEGFAPGEGICNRLINHTQNSIDRMGHDIDLREHLPQDLLTPTKHARECSMESETRSNLRNGGRHHAAQNSHDHLPPKPVGHRSRALSQSDIRGLRVSENYDSEAEFHHSNGSGQHSRDSPNSSGNGSANQMAPENNGVRGSSQLREMLQSPFNTWSRNYRPVATDGAGGATTPNNSIDNAQKSPSSTTTTVKDVDSAHTPYSFKRTIKERFKEELRRGSDPEIKIEIDDCSRNLGKRRPDSRSSGSNDCSDLGGSFDSLPGEYTASNIKRRASEPITSPATLPSATVPIFALHSSGNFYVPSSLNVNMISFDAEVPKGATSICHPVTINVNFSTNATTHSAASGGGNSLTVPSLTLFPRPMFLTPQQAAAASFLTGQMPYLQSSPMPTFGGGLTSANPTGVIHSVTGHGGGGTVMPVRRASLAVTPRESGGLFGGGLLLHNGAGGGSNIPSPAVPSRTSPQHILNLSQPHTRL